MNDDELLRLRDGREHRIGPLTLRYLGPGEGGPEGTCGVRTEDAAFMLDWMDAMAIAFCIAPTAALWGAFDSDREKQLESGQERGWLRLELTSDTERLGTLTGWTGKPFQVGRLVMDAQGGEKVTRRKGDHLPCAM